MSPRSFTGQTTRALPGELVRIPLLRRLLDRQYAPHSNHKHGAERLFHSVHGDFAAARLDIPPWRLEDFDNVDSPLRLPDERFRIFACDCRALFWLDRLLPQTRLLRDRDGNVGISDFDYKRHLTYPGALEWLMNDVPVVAGRRITAAGQPEAVALQNFGSALALDRLFNRQRFVGAFAQLRYPLTDAGKTPELGCRRPLLPAHSIPAHSGLHFKH